MTGPPAFSDIPQGSKTGFGYVRDPASETFIADPEGKPSALKGLEDRSEPKLVPAAVRDIWTPRGVRLCRHPTCTEEVAGDPYCWKHEQPQTFDLTYRFTGTTKHDPRLMLEATFRNGLPRGVTAQEVTE